MFNKKKKEKQFRYIVVANDNQQFFEKEDEVINYIIKNDLREIAKIYQEKSWKIELSGSYFE